MPVRKSRLNRVEQAEYRAAAQQLQAVGLIPTIPEGAECSRALHIVVFEGQASLVLDLSCGGVGYAIRVRLVAEQSGLTLLNCDITTEWDDEIFMAGFDERTPVCKLDWLEYQPRDVLNQRIDNGLRFHHRGEMAEGMILAMGPGPIPPAYSHGMLAPVELIFEDQFENKFGVAAEVVVDRTAKPKNAALRRGTGLYGPQRITESSEAAAGYLHAAARNMRFPAAESGSRRTTKQKAVSRGRD